MALPTPSTNIKSRIAESYNAITNKYNDWTSTHDHEYRKKFLSQFLEQLTNDWGHLEQSKDKAGSEDSPKLEVLELGCGSGEPVTGLLLAHSNPRIDHLIGNDISASQLALAQDLQASHIASNRLSLVNGDMLSLSVPPASLIAVLAFYSIIHLPRSEQITMMEKIALWLKPGGLFLGNFADQEGEELVEEKWLGEEKGWMFWSSWGGEGSVKMVEERGFEVVRKTLSDEKGDAKFMWILARKK